ncbi:hypothetical protein RHMOL_Rhmol12G0102500 [Rhododendron molle]|uniref:Uncharacterized protein n=1 Tax=Rhododendron molle TaxID=49168 RepID=A0ACC0LHJ6_RHOML|nr:hypothetical protein RHMOL_Rhmol12G0102500 [Rhododendron molle]
MTRPEVKSQNSNDFYECLFDNYDPYLSNTPTTPVTPTTLTPHASLPMSTPRGSMPVINAEVPKERKRTRMGEEKLSIHASMDTFFKSSSSYMEKMANSFGYDKELSA